MRLTTALILSGLVFCLCWSTSLAEEIDRGDIEQIASQSKFNVNLSNGLFVQAVGYSIQGDYVYLQYPSGAQSKFKKEEVDLSSLPPRTPANEILVKANADQPKPKPEPTSRTEDLFDSLRDAANKVHLRTDHIEIISTDAVQPPVKSPSPPELSNWEKSRKENLAGFDTSIALLAKRAAKLSDDFRMYVGGCTGSTTTHHSGTTSGAGINQGDGWIHPNEGSQPGQYSNPNSRGPSDFSYRGTSIWQQEFQYSSTTSNAETPYCAGLASEIRQADAALRPLVKAAIGHAYLSGTVVEADLNAILLRHGIAPVEYWER